MRALFFDVRIRGIIIQILVFIAVALFVGWVAYNTISNLRRLNFASGFDFLGERAGFDILQTPIPYDNNSSYFQAFLVGILNTLIVAVIGIAFASVLGFILGIARLSTNWIVSKVATVYIETIRNIPLLLQLLFWYEAVLHLLPSPQQGYDLPFGSKLSVRGLYLPRPIFGEGAQWALWAFLAGIAATVVLVVWNRQRHQATGARFPALSVGLGLTIALPVLAFAVAGLPVTFDYPELQRFNYTGGFAIIPELAALLLGLIIYTAAFIAEVVRAGILAIPRGQTEAAYSLGIRPGPTLRLVVIPQALRVIIPPLTNQYLNLTKNSSLAVAVGYPDLVGVFKNTVLNQTGHAIEVIFLTMAVYLFLSVATAAFMNWFNRRIALRER
jgi:general L-amino acid transport system permease protein